MEENVYFWDNDDYGERESAYYVDERYGGPMVTNYQTFGEQNEYN